MATMSKPPEETVPGKSTTTSVGQLLEELPSDRPLRVTCLDLAGLSAEGDDPCLLGSLVLRCPALKRLSLARNGLTDAAMDAGIGACLRFLRMSPESRAGTAAGVTATGLLHLDLSGNLLTPDGCEVAADAFFPDVEASSGQDAEKVAQKALPVDSADIDAVRRQRLHHGRPEVFHHLELRGNKQFGDLGAAALGRVLKRKRCFGSLGLRDTGISHAGLLSLADSAEWLVGLDLSGTKSVLPESLGALFRAIGDFDIIRTLDASNLVIQNSSGISSDGLGVTSEELVPLVVMAVKRPQCRLRRLSLARNGIDDLALRVLVEGLRRSGRCLIELDLDGSHLGEAGDCDAAMRSLSELLGGGGDNGEPALGGLQILSLSDCGFDDGVVDILAKGISTSFSLESLRLSGNQIGDCGAGVLKKAMLAQYSLITEANLQDVAQGLRELQLKHNYIGDVGLEALAEAASLTAPSLEAPRGPWGLSTLWIEGNLSSSRGMTALQQARRARSGLLEVLLRSLAGSQPPEGGGGLPPVLLRVDGLGNPSAEEEATEASLIRHWQEHFNVEVTSSYRWVGSFEAVGHDEVTLDEEITAEAAKREELHAAAASAAAIAAEGAGDGGMVSVMHMPSGEEPHMKAERPAKDEEEPVKRGSWLWPWGENEDGLAREDSCPQSENDDVWDADWSAVVVSSAVPPEKEETQ
eukprot:TRINITY_DN33959_c0_g1_i1.p1 TRINITY_DN33959_c0_g1~~TRINITY_DN33959_c0_g1_i1.p1  ORF type:complete len:695 (+),score=118.18 TRINITY_DN33959_c0_g1_i1:50-2134(+)